MIFRQNVNPQTNDKPSQETDKAAQQEETKKPENNFQPEQQADKPTIKDKIRQRWTGLYPEQKRHIIIAGVVSGLIVLSLLGYKIKYGNRPLKQNTEISSAKSEERNIGMDSGLIEKSLYTRTLSVIENQNKEIDQLRKSFEDLNKRKPVSPKQATFPPPPLSDAERHLSGTPVDPDKKPSSARPKVAIPPPPAFPADNKASPPAQQVIGGINIVKTTQEPKVEKKTPKKKDQIYLPPSFMEATLLSGVAASTTSAAKGNPLPVLLRIKDLAVLPNKVKANLKGCFAIAEATGNLADERVHIRLLTLSCVAKDGAAVIDQAIKGFVVDNDGKVGLSGRVVAKMGIHIARSALVGFLGGFGEAVEATSIDTTFSPVLGTTSKLWTDADSKNVLKAGTGKGIAQAAKELQKFYLQLAEQTLPVIEVGATKNVTMVISEGVNLEIQKQNIKM